MDAHTSTHRGHNEGYKPREECEKDASDPRGKERWAPVPFLGKEYIQPSRKSHAQFSGVLCSFSCTQEWLSHWLLGLRLSPQHLFNAQGWGLLLQVPTVIMQTGSTLRFSRSPARVSRLIRTGDSEEYGNCTRHPCEYLRRLVRDQHHRLSTGTQD